MSTTQKSRKEDADSTSFLWQLCRQTCRCLLLLALVFVPLQTVFGQTGNSSISGTITDPSQAVVAGALVTLTDPATGFHREVKTNQTGYYKFPDLLPGTYVLKVTQTGFASYATAEFQLLVSQDLSMQVKLTVGSETQQVTVAEAPPLLETETAAAGQVVESSQIVSLPLNGRDFLQLAALSPGTTPTPSTAEGSSASFAFYVSARPNSSVFVSGNRENGTSYLLDGIEMRDDRTGALTFQPSVDALQEFKVERSFFPADEGFHAAIVNVATKGGTNQFHGAAWEFIRNNKQAASNFFATTKPALHQNQFGVTADGPILRNKLLFMFDYEGLRLDQTTTATGIFPTTAELSGDFSASGLNPIYDPTTPGVRTQFPLNKIPAGEISQIAKNAIMMNFFPTGITGSPTAVNDVANEPSAQTDNQYMGRLDVPHLRAISHNDSLMFRIADLHSELHTIGLSPLSALSRPVHALNVVLQLASPIRSNLVNVVRLGYQYDFDPELNLGANATNYAAQMGLVNASTYAPNFFPPELVMTGYNSVGTSTAFNLNTTQNSYYLTDNITWVKNRHTIEVGYDERYNRTFINSGTYASGVIEFLGGFTSELTAGGTAMAGTGNAVADFLLGYPEIGIVAPGSSHGHFHYQEYGFFGEDNWKVTSNLDLQFGLRYEPSTYPWPEGLNNYIFDQQNGTLLFPILNEAPRGLLTNPHREIAPRVGFAWTPSFAPKTVVHAGGGTYFDMNQLNELQFQNEGPPFYNVNEFIQTGTTLTGINSFSNGGVFPLIQPTVPAPNYVQPAGTNLFSEDPHNKTPTNYQWNLNIQQQLASNSLFEVGYFGAKGIHLSKRLSGNTCSSATDYLCVPSREPFPSITGDLLLSTTRAWSDYHSLQARFEQRLTKGLTGLVGYTWGKAIDIDSGGAIGDTTERAACIQCDKGLSDFNISQRLVVSGTYELPFGRGKSFGSHLPVAADEVVGGWQLGLIGQFQGGVPNTVAASANLTGDKAVLNPRANCISSSFYASGRGNLLSNGFMWLNPAAYSNPAANTFGNCARDSFIGPTFNNVDAQLSKSFPIHDLLALDFRAEAFNVLNHPNFNLPYSSEANPALLGKITGAQSPRIIQFALKLVF